MHIKEGKVSMHPMNNLVDVFPDVIVRRLPPRSKRLTRTSILTGLKDSPSTLVLMSRIWSSGESGERVPGYYRFL